MSVLHERILDKVESLCKSRGYITKRQLNVKDGIIDLFAYHPERKDSIAYEVLTTPSKAVMTDKARRYSKVGKVVFVVSKSFEPKLKQLESKFNILYVDVEEDVDIRDIQKIADLFSVLGNETRLLAIVALSRKPRDWTELQSLVGAGTGRFAYHISEIMRAGIATKKNGKIVLTEFGRKLLDLFSSLLELDVATKTVAKEEWKHSIKKLKNVRKPRPWSERETSFLIENYGKVTVEEIAKRLGRSRPSVVHKARSLGLTRRFKPWSSHEIEYLRENYGKVPVCEIAAVLDRPVPNIYVKASELGLTAKKR